MYNFIAKMLRYKRWANERLFMTLKGMPNDALTSPQRIKFGNITATAQHVYEMDLVWKAHLTSSMHSFNSRVPTLLLSINELSDKQLKIDRWFQAFASHDLKLEEPISFDFIDGSKGEMTASEIFLHVVNHGTYHRGHIAKMLNACDVTPPITDLPVFLRDYFFNYD